MLGKLENKFNEFEKDYTNKNLQKELLTIALDEVAEICIGGLQTYKDDAGYLNTIITENIYNDDTLRSLKEILVEDHDMDAYERYLWKKKASITNIYSKYFNNYTCILEDGRIYNPIFNMYWDQEHELWQSDGSDGWVRFTCDMPYTKQNAVEITFHQQRAAAC